MAHILYLHQYFRTPAMGWSQRSWHIAKHWAAQGHKVSVVSARNGNALAYETIEGIEIIWLPIAYSNKMSKWRRMLAFIKFVAYGIHYAAAVHKREKADFAYVTSTPLTIGLVALWMKARQKVPFIFEVRDLWPDAPVQMGAVKGRLYKNMLYWLEAKLYTSAQAIVALSPAMASNIAAKAEGKEILMLPNFADVETFRVLRRRENPTDKVHIVYTGTFGLANDIEGMLLFFKYLQMRSKYSVIFTLVGEGAFFEKAEGLIYSLQIANITIRKQAPTAAIAQLLGTAHWAYVGFGPEPILETNSPNKLFDALAAGVPILLNMKGWLREAIQEGGAGMIVLKPMMDADTFANDFDIANQAWVSYSLGASQLAMDKFELKKGLQTLDQFVFASLGLETAVAERREPSLA